MTSAVFYHLAHFLNITIEIRNVCVFLAPLFSSLTVITTYFFTKELKVTTKKAVESTKNYKNVTKNTKFYKNPKNLEQITNRTIFYYINRMCLLFLGRRRWSSSSMHDCNCSGLHFSFRRGFVRQRRHRHLLYALHVRDLDQGCQDWIAELECRLLCCLLLHGEICF